MYSRIKKMTFKVFSWEDVYFWASNINFFSKLQLCHLYVWTFAPKSDVTFLFQFQNQHIWDNLYRNWICSIRSILHIFMKIKVWAWLAEMLLKIVLWKCWLFYRLCMFIVMKNFWPIKSPNYYTCGVNCFM